MSNTKPPLNNCCCCFSLFTGTIVSGAAGILLAVIGIIVMFVTDIPFQTIILDTLPQWAVKLILTINMAMTILISILLIVGAIKRSMFMMLPWVLLGILLAIGLLISVIYTAVKAFIDDHTEAGIYWLVLGLIFIVVYIYFWLVVYSFFQIVRAEHEDRGRYARTPYRR